MFDNNISRDLCDREIAMIKLGIADQVHIKDGKAEAREDI